MDSTLEFYLFVKDILRCKMHLFHFFRD